MLHPKRNLAFRPSGNPGICSPVTVRSTGYYCLQESEVRNPPRPFTQLFWVHSGSLVYERGGKFQAVSAGDTFHYRSRDPHLIRVGADPAAYYWLTFDGPQIGDWLETNLDGLNPHRAGPCPSFTFHELGNTIKLPTIAAEARAAELGLSLLVRALNNLEPTPEALLGREEKLCQELESLMEANYTDPDFGIETAAAALHCHRTTLFRIYRRRRVVSPSAFLQRLRLQGALKLLEDATRSINEVALAAGYRDANYFTKVFRRATGESPRAFREYAPIKLRPLGTSG